jgi:drug/metabolite transporter (DMT)-like permease
MIGRVLWVIIGFVVACLAAGLTMVLFVYTPAEMAGEAAAGDRFAEAGMLTLFAATQSAVFAAPFAFIGAGFGEWQKIGAWLYYALVAIAIAGVGFLAQFWSETGAEPSIVNSYAVTAFVAAGFVAGMVYWLIAGRFAAGDDGRRPEPDVLPPVKSQAQPGPMDGVSARVVN